MATTEQLAGLAAAKAFCAVAYCAYPDPIPHRVVDAMYETAYNCLDAIVDDNGLRPIVAALQAEDEANEATEDCDYSDDGFWVRVEAALLA